jgi:hypothetical protein
MKRTNAQSLTQSLGLTHGTYSVFTFLSDGAILGWHLNTSPSHERVIRPFWRIMDVVTWFGKWHHLTDRKESRWSDE